MIKFTKGNLEKLEDLFKGLGYTVRYEKGNFNSGYCLVENRKIVVINKFFETEGRINTLLEVLSNADLSGISLEEKNARFYQELAKSFEPGKKKEETSNL